MLRISLTFVALIGACVHASAQTSSSNATYGKATKEGNSTYVQPAGPTDTTKSPYVKPAPEKKRAEPVKVNGPAPEPVRMEGSSTGKTAR
jgi:hypothetical protein